MSVKSVVKPVVNKLGVTDEARELYITLLRLREGKRTSVETTGTAAEFHLETNMEYRMVCRTQAEDMVIERLLDELDPSDVFYDVGANVGRYTCLAANQGTTVCAFEPHPENANRLRENLELNPGSADVFEIALSDEDASGHLSLARDNELGEGGHKIGAGGDSSVPIEYRRGDTAIHEYELHEPTVVKIDVEGAECRVIEGFEETIRQSRPVLYIEVHPHHMADFGDSTKHLNRLLEQYGYVQEVIYERGKGHFIRATYDE